MIEVSSPGKLLLSGEWSVLELEVPCIVLAVDKCVTAKIEESEKIEIELKDFGIKTNAVFDGGRLVIEDEKEELGFAKHAIETTMKYLQGKGIGVKAFRLVTESEISLVELSGGSKTKVGFGSSAAAVVAIISAVLKLHGTETDSEDSKELIYKLGCISHYTTQGKAGSAFDVAASTYAEPIVYQRFDGKWLSERIENNESIVKLAESKWEHFKAEPIALPEDLELCVGFTGSSASTKELVLKMREAKKQDPEGYMGIINSIKRVTEELISAIKDGKKENILEQIRKNRALLKELGELSKAGLETKELTKLIELAEEEGAAAKFSGAGGGDCGIAVCFEPETRKKVEEKWEENGIYPIEIGLMKRKEA